MWPFFIFHKLSAELGAMHCLFPQELRLPFTRLEAGVRGHPGKDCCCPPSLVSSFLPLCPPLSCPPNGDAERSSEDIREGESEEQSRGNWGTTKLWSGYVLYMLIFPQITRWLTVEPVYSVHNCTFARAYLTARNKSLEQQSFTTYLLRAGLESRYNTASELSFLLVISPVHRLGST